MEEKTMNERLFEITSRQQLNNLNPSKKDKASFDIVKCVGDALVSERHRTAFSYGFCKMAYLAKHMFIFSWNMDKTSYHGVRECGLGKNLKFRDDIREWQSTGLRVERWLETVQFVPVKNYIDEKTGREIVEARRMPFYILEEGKKPTDYPYHSVVSLPLSYYEDTFFALVKRIKKTRGFWGKEEDVKKYIANFKPWLYHPTQFCLTCGHQHGGAHRLYMAKLMGHKRKEVVIYRCWWKDGAYFDPELLYDWGWKKYEKD
jgi:hypothetical protein